MLYRDQKKLNKALTMFIEAIDNFPDPDYYYELGNCLIDIKNYETAIKSYKTAESLGGKNVHLYLYNSACAALLTGDPEAALKYLESAFIKGYSAFNHVDKDPDLPI